MYSYNRQLDTRLTSTILVVLWNPTILDFEWTKRGCVANGPDFEWDLKSRQMAAIWSKTILNPDKKVWISNDPVFEWYTIVHIVLGLKCLTQWHFRWRSDPWFCVAADAWKRPRQLSTWTRTAAPLQGPARCMSRWCLDLKSKQDWVTTPGTGSLF